MAIGKRIMLHHSFRHEDVSYYIRFGISPDSDEYKLEIKSFNHFGMRPAGPIEAGNMPIDVLRKIEQWLKEEGFWDE